eukprot:gnl/MRDRNA2_/MRDRNA2_138510_c0_seq1.p1 gnl/MRDRNA2_/MRDRNA2_138510_c0~~gnl/MRDRNA2_/MRDRNA2_138510_c0_seq1.p1  ORF type:complete len:515 (-),score=93.73 gnl/MRDRNA2_/MRDRNA2_138510_c0_seq1:84-1628(-)
MWAVRLEPYSSLRVAAAAAGTAGIIATGWLSPRPAKIARCQSAATPEFHVVSCPPVEGQPLSALAAIAASKLKQRKETVTVFEATTGGLVNAALLSVPGASSYATCGANYISPRKSVQVLGDQLMQQVAVRVQDGAAYKESKKMTVLAVARHMREAVGTAWCIAESGACGPTFNFSGIDSGFTAICVSGPVERVVFVESSNSDRERNMWGFTKVALDLFAECLEEASACSVPAKVETKALPNKAVFEGIEDRYQGVNVNISPESRATATEFESDLRSSLVKWRQAGKRGIWFKVPQCCARFVPVLISEGFRYHHAKPDYVMLARWLENSESKLPTYGFTQVGVGGLVINSKNEVLMVQERISPMADYQGIWKFPGGLADPGEDFGVTASREVMEETGVPTEFLGLVSIRHTHKVRFGQGDLYCVVKLKATSEQINLDPEELADAKWMSIEEIRSRVPKDQRKSMDGCVSGPTCRVIEQGLQDVLIQGAPMPSSRGPPTMIYAATELSKAVSSRL